MSAGYEGGEVLVFFGCNENVLIFVLRFIANNLNHDDDVDDGHT